MRRTFLVLATVAVCVCLVVATAEAQSVVGSRHDMTDNTLNRVSGTEAVCVFCHTPHAGDNTNGPLWNRVATSATYTPYSSATIQMTIATTAQTGTNLCMSCHDGSVGINVLRNAPTTQTGVYGSALSSQNFNTSGFTFGTLNDGLDTELGAFGTDLSNQHPVGITYDIVADPDFKTIAAAQGAGLVFYGASTDQVECSTCHDVHEYTNIPFLRISNDASAMCVACHSK